MPRFGTITRQYPRVVVVRGFNPNEPHTMSSSVPVKSAVVIKSGQVVSKEWVSANNQYEWVLGVSDVNAIPHIAYNDSVDEDVVESGTLPALSALGEFEIQTAFYKAGDTYNDGVALTYDGVTGNLKAAAGGDNVIGFVSRIHGPVVVSGTNSNVPAGAAVIQFTTGFKKA